jgi:phenylpropionate dioxygenase-like ring-hydroxylating dioxygenase large terminal subunit
MTTLTHRDVQEAGRRLAEGFGLPPHWYTDSEIYRQEQHAIWRKAWVCVGHDTAVREPNTFMTSYLGDMPVVVTHAADGVLRAFANICRHRSHPVAKDCGRQSVLTCPYHAWTYALDGRLVAAPSSSREAAFDKTSHGLQELRLAKRGPMIFLNSDPNAPSFEEHTAGLFDHWVNAGIDLNNCEFDRDVPVTLAGNWKNYVDNSLECYHCPAVHSGLAKLYDLEPGAYEIMNGTNWHAQSAMLRPDQASRLPAPSEDRQLGYQFAYIFPNLSTLIWLDRMNRMAGYAAIWFRPEGPGRVQQIMSFFFAPGATTAERKDLLDQQTRTKREDQSVIEAVQRAQETGAAQSARFMMDTEHGVHHFQKNMICPWMLASV